MGRRPTIADVAGKAGVSVATVDRVLNARHPVREETARRVYEAASEIGYHAAALIQRRITADLPKMEFAFLLQKAEQHFYQAFANALRNAAEKSRGVRVSAHVEFVRNQTPTEVAARLHALGQQADAVAATSLDHHAVTQVVQALRERGTPVFSLLSDFAQGVRESYVGLNNMKVGRTAAWFISRMAPQAGKVAIFVGSHRWHGHELREAGFRSYFREYAPHFDILETLVNLETEQVTYETTLGLFERYPDLVGLYVAGGGMEGALAALRQVPRDSRLAVVVNELTQDSAAALQEHRVVAAIATPLDSLCRTLIDHMATAVRNGLSEAPGQLFLPHIVHVPESL